MRGPEQRTLMRVHVEEQDKVDGHPVYERIVEMLRHRGLAGATAYRAIEGFGATSHLHAEHALSVRTDVPVVIECVDVEGRIAAVLPEIARMVVGGGIVTLEQVRAIIPRDAPRASVPRGT